jgi:hypothetical protein
MIGRGRNVNIKIGSGAYPGGRDSRSSPRTATLILNFDGKVHKIIEIKRRKEELNADRKGETD